MHYLITGHTGFKGSWLSLMLQMQGHTISGISLDPNEKSLFNQAKLSNIYENDIRLDIRKREEINQTVQNIDPDVIVHLAAQPLVGESFKFPVETFDTNVIGTLNVLEASKNLNNLKATLIITTDKVYKNKNQLRGYVETDELGGDDPYSASKAAADIAAQSWIRSFATSPVAIARAGNVIGGGDWALNRIIPDLVNAFAAGQTPILRYPDAIRPWQHVLDCLAGYLKLIDYQIRTGLAGVWNFGPDIKESYAVKDLVREFGNYWGGGIKVTEWEVENSQIQHETSCLLLDSSRARKELDWGRDQLSFQNSIKWTVDWYKMANEEDIRALTNRQLDLFFSSDEKN